MRRKEKTLIIISIIGIVLSLSGITYAYLRGKSTQENDNIVNTLECLKVSLTGENDIELNNAYSITDEEGEKLNPYTFTLTNECNMGVNVSINLEDLSIDGIKDDEYLKDEYLKVKLDNIENNLTEKSLLSQFKEAAPAETNARSSHVLGTYYIHGKATKTFNLRLWIDENVTWNNGGNKHYKGKIVALSSPAVKYIKLNVDLNGGTSNQGFKEEYMAGEKLELMSPTKERATFNGWEITSGNGNILQNLVINGSFENDLNDWNWSNSLNASLDYTQKYSGNSSIKINNPTATLRILLQRNKTLTIDHVYYGSEYIYFPTKTGTSHSQFDIFNENAGASNPNYPEYGNVELSASNNWQHISFSFKSGVTSSEYSVRPVYFYDAEEINIDSVQLIDLTAAFGSGSEPTQEWCDENLSFFDNYFLVLNDIDTTIKALWT